MTEIEAYSQTAKELADSQRHEGLWLKCYSEADGDEAKAKISYARLRVAILMGSDRCPNQREGTVNGFGEDARSTNAESQFHADAADDGPSHCDVTVPTESLTEVEQRTEQESPQICDLPKLHPETGENIAADENKSDHVLVSAPQAPKIEGLRTAIAITIAGVVIYACFEAFRFWEIGRFSVHQIPSFLSYAMGSNAIPIVGAFFTGLIGSLISRNWSTLWSSYTIAFALLWISLIIIPQFVRLVSEEERSKPAADFISEGNERQADWKKDVAGQLESKGVYEVDLPKVERTMDVLKQKAEKLDPKEKEIVEALSSVNDQMLVVAKRYEGARQEYVKSGGTDASSIRTLEHLNARERVIRDFGLANDALLNFLQSIDSQLTAALAKVDLTQYQRTEAIQNYKTGASLEVLLAIRELDQQIANDSLRVVSLLRKEWGKWKVQGTTVLFDRDSAATEFNSVLGRIAAAGKKQVALQGHFAK